MSIVNSNNTNNCIKVIGQEQIIMVIQDACQEK